MTWGEFPKDLDLHLALIYDDSFKNCEVYFSNQECEGSSLDTDSQDGRGPETISIEEYECDALYMVYVFDYDHDKDHPLSESEGRVYISPNGKDSTAVAIPSEEIYQRYFWMIGCFHGEDGLENIRIVNKLVFVSELVLQLILYSSCVVL